MDFKCKNCGKRFNSNKKTAKYCSQNCYHQCPKANHKLRLQKIGNKNHRWRGGKVVTEQGYIRIRGKRKNYLREHRIVMEKYLGRKLKPTEIVHHINGNNSDNRIENLKLFKSNSEHARFHFYNGYNEAFMGYRSEKNKHLKESMLEKALKQESEAK